MPSVQTDDLQQILFRAGGAMSTDQGYVHAPLPRMPQLRMARLLDEIAREIHFDPEFRDVLTELATAIRLEFAEDCQQGMGPRDW